MPNFKKISTRAEGPKDRWGYAIEPGSPVIGEGSPAQRRLLDGMARLLASRGPGQVFSTREIARATGFSPKYIQNTERSALRKMRARLPVEVRDSFDELLAAGRIKALPKPAHHVQY